MTTHVINSKGCLIYYSHLSNIYSSLIIKDFLHKPLLLLLTFMTRSMEKLIFQKKKKKKKKKYHRF